MLSEGLFPAEDHHEVIGTGGPVIISFVITTESRNMVVHLWALCSKMWIIGQWTSN